VSTESGQSHFNGAIPLVAIQMSALRVEDGIALVFTKVLDQMVLGLVDDDEDVTEVTDRSYWEKRAPKTIANADALVALVKTIDAGLEANYTKFYIGLAKAGTPNNFVIIQPRKNHLIVGIRMSKSDEVEAKLEESGLDLMDYQEKRGRYRLRLKPGDEAESKELLEQLFSSSYSEFGRGAGTS